MNSIGQQMGAIATAVVVVVAGACSGGGSDEQPPGGGTQPAVDGAQPAGDGAPLPLSGTLIFKQFDDSPLEYTYFGLVEYALPSGPLVHFADGSDGWRHPNGSTVFRQNCGELVHRIVVMDAAGLITPVTGCSSTIANPGYTETDFGFSRLSPDATKVAVEAYYYDDDRQVTSTHVFALDGSELATFPGVFAPTWLPNGALLAAGEGLWATDEDLGNLARIDGGLLQGPVNNPDVHPDGDRIVFEYNQQLWQMNLDGTGLEGLVIGARQWRFPAWSPDGHALAYLGMSAGFIDNAIYFTDLDAHESYTIDFDPIFGPLLSNPGGPLSWRP
jgi:hypothetical protein